MGFASLGSGSRGNGTLVFLGEKLFLVDCGFSLKQAEPADPPSNQYD